MSVALSKHLEEGERLLALVASDAEEKLFEQLAQWTSDLYVLVEEGSEDSSAEELQKAKEANARQTDSGFSTLGNAEELVLLQKLMQLPDEVAASVREINPARLATHIFNTARAFNQFYNKHPVLHSDNPALVADRLALIAATAQVLKKGLHLLGIDVLENM